MEDFEHEPQSPKNKVMLVELEGRKKILKIQEQNQTLDEIRDSIKKAFSLDAKQKIHLEFFVKEFNEFADLDDVSDLPDDGIRLKVTKINPKESDNAEVGSVESSSVAAIDEDVFLSDIKIQKKLGGGAFGSVFSALWQGTSEVAVKRLNSFSKEAFQDLAQEAKMLIKLRHVNVLYFFGIYVSPKEEYYLVTEMCPLGNLRDFLIASKGKFELDELVGMAKDAAAGMAYLSANNVIHRDLAARNLLVKKEDNRYLIKVGDFGMSKIANSSKYYQAKDQSKIAYKWAAPEAVTYGKYSFQSDVWSFGVTLYEILTWGAEPYLAMTNREALENIQKGYRLPCPNDCPQPLFDLMLACWNEKPAKRPEFRDIYQTLDSWTEQLQLDITGKSIGNLAEYILLEGPDELHLRNIWPLVFEYLDPVSLLRVTPVCRNWNTMGKSPSIWKQKVLQLFSHAEESYHEEKNFEKFPEDGIDWFKYYWQLLHEDNLVLNPTFSKSSATWNCDGSLNPELEIHIKQWKQLKEKRETMNWYRSQETSFVGIHSMKGKGGEDPLSKRIATKFRLKKNDCIVVSVWAKAFNPKEAKIYIECNGGDYKWTSSRSAWHPGTGKWELLQTHFGPVTSNTECYLYLWNSSTTTYAFFDHCVANRYYQDSEQLKSLILSLFDAAKSGNKSKIESIWQKNNMYHEQLIESVDPVGGFSALYRAAQKGHLEVVKLLIEYGYDIESKKGDGSTPLYIACQENKLDVVNYLIEKGANIECIFKTGFTPMYIASQKGHLDVVKTLVKNGAKVDAASEHGATPLYIGCQNGHYDVADYLISVGANIEAKFKDGFTPIYIASQKGHVRIVELLLDRGADMEARGGDSTALYVASQNGHFPVVKTLVERGAYLNTKFKGFYTPVYISAQKGHTQILRYLLDQGASMEQSCSRGSTALYVAAQNGHLECVQVLISKGANPEVHYFDGIKDRKPIDIAKERGYATIEEALITYMKEREKERKSRVSQEGKKEKEDGKQEIELQPLKQEKQEPDDKTKKQPQNGQKQVSKEENKPTPESNPKQESKEEPEKKKTSRFSFKTLFKR